MFGSLKQDIRYNIRTLLKSRGLAFIVVLTFALGVGANTAIFSVINGVLLKPLPFKEPGRIVGVRETLPDEGSIPASYRTFAELRDRNTVFENIACMTKWEPNLESGASPIRVSGMAVSASYFDVMGHRPILGRTFLPGEDRIGVDKLVVLSHELWQQQFGGDPNVVNQSVRISGRSLTVIGVMPPALSSPEIGWMQIWTQITLDDQKARENPGRYLRINARLKPGVSIEQARAQLDGIMHVLHQSYPQTHGQPYGVDIRSLADVVVAPHTRLALFILFGVVGCVLIIACVNISNLLLARAVGREREMAIRSALGAGRGRLISQLLTESLILSLVGGLAGLLLAQLGLKLLLRFSTDAIPRVEHIQVDMSVLGFTLGVATIAGVVFGLAPALVTTKLDLNDVLKEGSRGVGHGVQHRRLRGLLVVSEVAIALILLIASGLMVRSYWRLSNTEPGFNLDNVLTMDVNLPPVRFPENSQVVAFYREALQEVSALPGVSAAAASQSLLLRGPIYTDPVLVEGQPLPPEGQEPYIRQNIVSSDYFKTMGISFLKGRPFTEQETWETGGALIVNQAFVNRFFPGEDSLGKRIRLSVDAPWMTIVGVVANTIQSSFEDQTIPEMFYPYVNSTTEPLMAMSLVIQTNVEPMSIAGSVRSVVQRIDPTLPLSNVMTMRMIADSVLAKPRLNLLLTAIFAGLALVLAAIGIYSVMSFIATQRTHEIGVRMALGARAGHVFWLIIGQGMKLVLLGLALGVLGALILTRVLTSLLFGITGTDPITYIGAPLLLALIALLACYFPARRAMNLDPLAAVRYE